MSAIIKQFGSILDLVKHFDTEQKCIEHLTNLRWGGNVVSPSNKESKVYVCKGNKYKCKETGKYFNVRTGTFFDDTKIPLQKWFIALWLMSSHKKGISSHQLAKDIGVTQKTAWYMLHRLRNAFGNNSPKGLGYNNAVEADETYVGGKETNKHKHKKNENWMDGKITVLGAVERGGNVVAEKTKVADSDTVPRFIYRNVIAGAKLMTDNAKFYFPMQLRYEHKVVKHDEKEYVRGIAHTNTIEGFWSLFKRGVVGIYHHVSEKHINNYLIEFSFRYNTRTFAEMIRFNYILTNLSNTKLKYSTLIEKKNE